MALWEKNLINSLSLFVGSISLCLHCQDLIIKGGRRFNIDETIFVPQTAGTSKKKKIINYILLLYSTHSPLYITLNTTLVNTVVH